MALKPKARSSGVAKKHSSSSTSSRNASKPKKSTKPSAPPPKQHKPKPTLAAKKKIPPHARYTEKDLKLAPLNGIRPAGVQKLPNKKKGKTFVDDASMRTILAMVMAEKEGNLESKMMRVRQLEELREARRAEAEKRAEGKQGELEERKSKLKKSKRKKQNSDTVAHGYEDDGAAVVNRPGAGKRKKVRFG